jgi:predicted ATPase
MIGLCGSHRTGKTSLAKAYAEKHGILFLETPTTAIFKELGIDPAAPMDFATRMLAQETIIECFDQQYAAVAGKAVITDRTPVDTLGYMLGDISGATVAPQDEERLARYVQRCYDVLNRRFSALMLVQPGIEVVPAPGKASLSKAYIEHLNSLMLGLQCDQRVKVPHFYLPREVVDMTERIMRLENVVGRAGAIHVQDRQQHQAAGGFLQ